MDDTKRDAAVSPPVSAALDLVRLALALTVAWSHWTQPFFQDGRPDLSRLGIAAVGGFFVLSGFTIRMIDRGGDRFNAPRYFADRLSRLWSVALPALLFTCALDWASHAVAPDFYDAGWGHRTTVPAVRVLFNALFLTQFWGFDIMPFSNSPFWSLGYEAGFYLLYGLYRSRRYAWLTVAALLLGPNILVLFPAWLGGAALYDLCFRTKRRGLLIAVCAVAFTAAAALLTACLRSDFTTSTQTAINDFFEAIGVEQRRVDGTLVLSSLVALFGFASVFGMLRLSADGMRIPAPVLRGARALGEATFPLYLMHFPLFVFVAALGFYDRASTVQGIGVFAAAVVGLGCTPPLANRVKRWLRPRLLRLFESLGSGRHATAPAASSGI